MSVQIARGFEIGTPEAFFNTVFPNTGGVISFGAGGRNSSNALIFNSTAGREIYCIKTLPVALSTVNQVVATKTTALPATGIFRELLVLRNAGAEQCKIGIRPDGVLEARRGATVLGSSAGFAMVVNEYNSIEFDVVCHTTAGSVKIIVNNSEKFSQGGLNTAAAGGSTVTEILIGGKQSISTPFIQYCDDWVVDNSAQPGDCRVREELPNGTGSQDDGVPTGAANTLAAVSENPPDGDTTRSALVTVGHRFLLTHPAIPTDESVVAVGCMPYLKKSAAGTASGKVVLKIGANFYYSDEIFPSTDYAHIQKFFMVNPDTSNAWAPGEVNALEKGLEKIS